MTTEHPTGPSPEVWWDRDTNVVITDCPSWPAGTFTPNDAVRLVPLMDLQTDARKALTAQLNAEDRELAALREVDDLRAEVEILRAGIARVRALCDGAEKRAHEMVGMFSGKKGAEVPRWVDHVRCALGTEEAGS